MSFFNKEKKSEKKKGAIRENLEILLIALIFALIIKSFIFQAYKIPSSSMEDTLLIGDYLIVNKFIYGIRIPFINKEIIHFSDPKKGEIIVFEFPDDPSKDFIKRVMATSNDKIEIRDKSVFINGKKVEEDYTIFKDKEILPEFIEQRDNMRKLVIPEDSYFVMGDNRDRSYDSRYWGVVKKKYLKGKAFIIYWSWNKEKFWPRFKRIGTLIN